MEMLEVVFLKASGIITKNIKLNSVGSRTQPCFTPFVTRNGANTFPSSSARVIMPSWNCLMIFMDLCWEAAKLRHDLPQSVSAYGVQCFTETNKYPVAMTHAGIGFKWGRFTQHQPHSLVPMSPSQKQDSSMASAVQLLPGLPVRA